MSDEVLANARPFTETYRTKQTYYPHEFTPTIAIPIIARGYSYWVRNGRKPVDPDFFQKVMLSDPNAEAHLFWFDDVIRWLKFTQGYK